MLAGTSHCSLQQAKLILSELAERNGAMKKREKAMQKGIGLLFNSWDQRRQGTNLGFTPVVSSQVHRISFLPCKVMVAIHSYGGKLSTAFAERANSALAQSELPSCVEALYRQTLVPTEIFL